MKERFRFSDLWRWSGTVSRGRYAVVGFLGFALKHNLDRGLAQFVFGRPWGFFNYWVPLDRAANVAALPPEERNFLITMALMSLPFIWVGLAMTVRRLRSAGLPTWLAVLFFAPFVNLLFLLILAVVPGHEERANRWATRLESPFDRLVPRSAIGAAAVSVVVTGLLGTVLVWLSVTTFRSYGWGLFLGIPFAMGFLAAALYGYHERRSLPRCLGVAVLSPALLGALLVALAIEGLGCVVMAIPIGTPLALLGGGVGYVLQRHAQYPATNPAMLAALIFALPLLMGMEAANPQQPAHYEVVSTIEVNAAPEKVWERVIGFTPLPAPSHWVFRTGIAYPMRAEMRGTGVGAVRHCVFSTGAFVEPIEVWDAPRRLKFSVTASPPPMEEWTPYGDIKATHLSGFLESKGGQFLLTPLPGGRTRIDATTWYKHGMWPESYWRVWSDWLIHRIHVRVLEHVKQEAEK